MTLRPARANDAPAMAHLSRDLIEGGLRWRYTPARMATLVADPLNIALVADESALQGFAVMQFAELHAHLVLLCVRPSRQRQGLGRQMHEWLLASARVAGIETIGLELRDDNVGALAFYERLGFAQTQWVPAYYDAFTAARRMTLRLHAAAP